MKITGMLPAIGFLTRYCSLVLPAADQGWEANLIGNAQAMADHLSVSLQPWTVPERTFPVENHGAVADGTTVNTKAIQASIDACAATGGGVVSLARGDYVTGTIVLASGVMLEIAERSRLLGSLDLADYPDHVAQRRTVMDTHMNVRQSLIVAEGVEHVGIRGLGEIDFRCAQENFPGKQTIGATPGRPFGIRVLDSRRILVENITLKNSPCWMQNYLNCEDLILQRVTVINQANHNNDGIDIDGCRRVIVRDCVINAEDDALCFKGASLRPTEDVLIENSSFFSTCNGLKIGTDTQGDFRRIYARNLRLGGIPDDMPTAKGRQASSGITLATVDGGDVEDIVIEKCVIERTQCPIFMRIGSRGRLMPGMPPAGIGSLRRILVQDISGRNNFRQGSFISGIEGGMIQDVLIRRVDLHMEGGGTDAMASSVVAEDEKGYPDAHQFSQSGLPSFGFFLRHAQRIRFNQVRVTPTVADARPSMQVGSNVAEITLDGIPLAMPPASHRSGG